MALKGGFAGKVAVIDLTAGTAETISSEPYQVAGGGHTTAMEILFDQGPDFTKPYDAPSWPIVLAACGLAGTGVPAVERTVAAFCGPHSFPKEWVTRSGFGGRFGTMMKAAGYDAIAVKGASKTPVWINIVEDKITIESAADLWGMGTWATQQEIWSRVHGTGIEYGNWSSVGGKTRDAGRTTQRPAVVAIGPGGENKVRFATLTHDSGSVAGQGGSGAVFGVKNLKAISVYGTKSIPVNDPKTVLALRMEHQAKYGYDVDKKSPIPSLVPNFSYWGLLLREPGFSAMNWHMNAMQTPNRPQGCMGCYICCRHIFPDTAGNSDQCVESIFWGSDGTTNQRRMATMLDDLGINAFQYMDPGIHIAMNKKGVMGPGMKVESKLPFANSGSVAFAEAWINAMVYRTDIGADWAEGPGRALTKWGLWDSMTKDGSANYPYHNTNEHYDPRLEVDWSYGSVIGSRDRNNHAYNWEVHWLPTISGMVGATPDVTAEELVNMMAQETELGDPLCWDYSAEGIYTDARLKGVLWLCNYSEWILDSVGFCDWAWPHFATHRGGSTMGKAIEHYENKFWNAVTGENIDTKEAQFRGEKHETLERAMHALQGRVPDDDHITDYVFEVPTSVPYLLPALMNGKWVYDTCLGRTLDRAKFADVKLRLYAMSGWNANGVPTKETLDKMGYGRVAEALSKAGKL